MKIKKLLCIAFVLCLLCSVAAADGYGSTVPPVNIKTVSTAPYHWEVQHRNGQALAWNVEDLFDGNWNTCMEYVGWNNEALDEIPEITLYFNNATIKDIWFRNAKTSDDPNYKNYARYYRIEVTIWVGNEEQPRRTEIFNKLPDVCDPSLLGEDNIDGYQRLPLKETYYNVTKVELWLKGWYPGEGDRQTKYWMQMADMMFLPDTLGNLFGYQIFDPGYSGYTQAPAQPTPAVTAGPYLGVQTTTNQRLSTRSGPGTKYTGQGSYFEAGKQVTALSRAYDSSNGIWWIQVELNYAGELRRVYTGLKRLNLDMNQTPVPEEQSQGIVILNRSVFAYWGPGFGYTMYKDQIPAGTSGEIWMTEDNYALFEFYDTATSAWRRVWVPLDALESSNG